MAASSLKVLNLLVVLALVGLVLIAAGEARPLMNVMEGESSANGIEGLVKDGLSALVESLELGAIKNSGPSPGAGH